MGGACITCEKCGTSVTAQRVTKRFCADCGKRHERERMRQWRSDRVLTYQDAEARFAYEPATGRVLWRRGKRAGEEAGYFNRTGYRCIWAGGSSVGAHRIAWLLAYGRWPDGQIDHINGDRADNRLSNLREATHQENVRNCAPRGGASRFKGVYLGRSRWRADISVNNRKVHLGTFETEEDAARAYDAAAIQYFGEFARLNFTQQLPAVEGGLTPARYGAKPAGSGPVRETAVGGRYGSPTGADAAATHSQSGADLIPVSAPESGEATAQRTTPPGARLAATFHP